MPELIPADRTIRALIVALLEMPMDAVVEVDVGNSGPLLGVASVEKQPGTGFGQQFITLKVRDA
jgi:bisphosphoglycerate-dependent phosphoglycerate mutase